MKKKAQRDLDKWFKNFPVQCKHHHIHTLTQAQESQMRFDEMVPVVRRTLYHELRVAIRNKDYNKIRSIMFDQMRDDDIELYPFCLADRMEFSVIHETVEYRLLVTPKTVRLGYGKVDPYRFEIEVVTEDASDFLHEHNCSMHSVPRKLKAALLAHRQVMLQRMTTWLLTPTTETIDLGHRTNA